MPKFFSLYMEMYTFFRSIVEPCNPQRRFMNLVGALVVYHAKKKEQTGYLEYLLLMTKIYYIFP